MHSFYEDLYVLPSFSRYVSDKDSDKGLDTKIVLSVIHFILDLSNSITDT